MLSLTMIIRVSRSLTVSCAPGSSERMTPVPGAGLGGEGDSVGELELAGFDLAEDFGHQGNFDDRHGVHLSVGVERDGLSGLQAFDVDTPLRVDGFRDALDVAFETREGILRGGWLGAGEGGETGEEESSHVGSR